MPLSTDQYGFSDRRARRVLFALIVVYALLGAALGYYKCWHVYRTSVDSAMLGQLIWATSNGHGLLYSPLWAQNFLAQNFCPLVLLLVPVFKIAPHFVVLLFCQSLAIGLCAWPAYLLARRRIDDNLACLLLALVTLLYPTVFSQNFNQFIPHILGLPFILAALYFYETRAFGRFVLCGLLAVAGKETFALPILMFAPVALFQRRPWKWAAFSLIFAAGFLALYFQVIGPYFRGGAAMHSGIYLGYLGDTPGEVLRSLIREPEKFGEVLSAPAKWAYPFLLLAPVGFFLPLLGWPALLGLPDFCINMVSASESFTIIGFHYGTVIGVFLCAAAIQGVERLSRVMSLRWDGQRHALVLSLALLVICLGSADSAFHPSDWDPLPHHDTLSRAIEMVPPEASVLCTQNLIVHLAFRLNACDDTMLKWRFAEEKQFEAMTRFDYIVLDVSPPFPWSPQVQEWARRLLAHSAYQTLLYENWTLVLERRTKGLMDELWKGDPEF